MFRLEVLLDFLGSPGHYRGMPRGIYDRKPRWPAHVRFWKKVNKNGPNGCWVWTGSVVGGRYGRFRESKERGVVCAHRFSWELHKGPIPDGEGFHGTEVCHNCPGGDNPRCVNPDHLYLGTHQENMSDSTRKGRNPLSKLSMDQAMEIRGSQLPNHELAKKYDVTKNTISRIKRGVRWVSTMTQGERDAVQKTLTKKQRRLTPEEISEILLSDEKPRFIAARLGMRPKAITRTRLYYGGGK